MDRVEPTSPRSVGQRKRAWRAIDDNRDLGFGSMLAREQALRLLNRDGSFNVAADGRGLWSTAGAYHALLSLTWPHFFGLIVGLYLVFNFLFAGAYAALGPAALRSDHDMSPFLTAFFFSVHTFATIGYGSIVPAGVIANALVTVESLVSLLTFAFVTGLVFARFSRPSAHIIYSNSAVIAPYRGITGFQFRVVNGRRNQLIELHAMVVLTRFEDVGGVRQRQFYYLALERDHVAFFPLTWTIVHPIDESSPLHGWSQEELKRASAEFLILITAFDETFSQTVHSRSSYASDEIIWNARFVSAFRLAKNGRFAVDLDKLHAIELLNTESATA